MLGANFIVSYKIRNMAEKIWNHIEEKYNLKITLCKESLTDEKEKNKNLKHETERWKNKELKTDLIISKDLGMRKINASWIEK